MSVEKQLLLLYSLVRNSGTSLIFRGLSIVKVVGNSGKEAIKNQVPNFTVAQWSERSLLKRRVSKLEGIVKKIGRIEI